MHRTPGRYPPEIEPDFTVTAADRRRRWTVVIFLAVMVAIALAAGILYQPGLVPGAAASPTPSASAR